VEQAANEIKRLKGLYQQSDQRSGASRHLEWRPEAVMAEQNREEKIAMSDASARPASGGLAGYALSVLLVALSTGVTLLLQDYTFRTPLFFPRHPAKRVVWRDRPGTACRVALNLIH